MRLGRLACALVMGVAGCSSGGPTTGTSIPVIPVTPVTPVTPPSYAAYTQSYTLPWVGSPNFANLNSFLQVQAQVNGGVVSNFVVSTGSVGVVLPATEVPNIPPNSPAGSATYTALGLTLTGVVVTAPVNFPGAVNASGVTTTATATLPVLAVTSATCSGSGVNASLCTTTIPHMLGVGFGIDTTVATSPAYNPFLNLNEMVAGTMRRGYVISRTGMILGLTAADTAPAFSMEALTSLGTPAAGTHNDWGLIVGEFEEGSATSPSNGSALVDTGLTDMILESAASPQSGSVGAGTTISVAIGTEKYTFAVGDGGAETPTSVVWANATHGTYVNPGLRALAHFDVLFDADGGYYGLRPE